MILSLAWLCLSTCFLLLVSSCLFVCLLVFPLVSLLAVPPSSFRALVSLLVSLLVPRVSLLVGPPSSFSHNYNTSANLLQCKMSKC